MGLTYEEAEPIWDARNGIVHHGDVPFHECVRRLHRALPTIAHARELIEALLAELGDLGREDPYTNGTKTMVLRADPESWWMRRSPAALYEGVEYNECDVMSDVPMNARPADAPPDWTMGTPFRPTDPKPDIAPDGLGKAVLTFFDGDAMLEMKYDDRGLAWPDRVVCRFGDRWGERRYDGIWPPSVDPSARPPQPPPPAWFVDFPESITVGDLAARIIAGCDPALDPVRVRMHVDAPGGVEGRWFQAKVSLRKLAHDEKLPTGGGVLVLDAFEHDPEVTCLALGRNLEEAEAAWLVEERRVRPRVLPETPGPSLPVDDLPDDTGPTEEEIVGTDGKKRMMFASGTVHLVALPVREIPWPIPGPRTTPAVAVRIPPLPAEVPPAWRAEGFSRWRYLVGESGRIGFALIRDEVDGFTQVGDGLVDIVDPRGLEQAILRAIHEWERERFPWPEDEPPWARYPYEHSHFVAWDNMRQTPRPLTAGGFRHWGLEWSWRDMDGDVYRWGVSRMRHVGR